MGDDTAQSGDRAVGDGHGASRTSAGTEYPFGSHKHHLREEFTLPMNMKNE